MPICKLVTFYYFFRTCIPSCPPRSYADETGLCKQCHESCATCIGPGQDNCVRCAMDHFRITDLDICMQQCPEGYFESECFYLFFTK